MRQYIRPHCCTMTVVFIPTSKVSGHVDSWANSLSWAKLVFSYTQGFLRKWFKMWILGQGGAHWYSTCLLRRGPGFDSSATDKRMILSAFCSFPQCQLVRRISKFDLKLFLKIVLLLLIVSCLMLRRPRPEDCKFKAIPGNIMKLLSQKIQTKRLFQQIAYVLYFRDLIVSPKCIKSRKLLEKVKFSLSQTERIRKVFLCCLKRWL